MKSRGIITMSTAAIVCLAVLSLPVTTNTQPKSPSKDEDVMKLLEVSGSRDVAVQYMDMLVPMLKKLCSDSPETFFDDFMAEIDMDEFLEMYIPIYGKFFTHDEIKEMIKFYESPVGKKMIEVLPSMMEETMEASQKLAQRISERLIKKLEEAEDK